MVENFQKFLCSWISLWSQNQKPLKNAIKKQKQKILKTKTKTEMF